MQMQANNNAIKIKKQGIRARNLCNYLQATIFLAAVSKQAEQCTSSS